MCATRIEDTIDDELRVSGASHDRWASVHERNNRQVNFEGTISASTAPCWVMLTSRKSTSRSTIRVVYHSLDGELRVSDELGGFGVRKEQVSSGKKRQARVCDLLFLW